MAIIHSTSKARSGRNRRKRSVGRSRNPRAGQKSDRHEDSQPQSLPGRRAIRITARLRMFLDSEQEALIKAQSLLACVVQAMQPEHSAGGPYYPDIIGLAADILKRRVVNLDVLLLDGLVPVNQGCRGD